MSTFYFQACLLVDFFTVFMNYGMLQEFISNTPCLLLYKSASQTPYENPTLLLAGVGRLLQQKTPQK